MNIAPAYMWSSGDRMKELFRTNDLVLVSWIDALLADSEITLVVFDSQTSVLEGSAGAIPRRLMVIDEDYDPACRVIELAGGGKHLA